MLPVVLGLALAIPLAAFTAATGPGGAFRRFGLLRIPEEARPPTTLAEANTLYRELKAAEGLEESGIARLARDPVLAAQHRRMLPPARRKGHDPIDVPLLIARTRIEEADTAAAAWTAMSRAERAAALGDAQALDGLLALPAAT
jgi:membrane glycosyltransferase